MTLQWMLAQYFKECILFNTGTENVTTYILLNSVESIRKYAEIFCPTDATPKKVIQGT